MYITYLPHTTRQIDIFEEAWTGHPSESVPCVYRTLTIERPIEQLAARRYIPYTQHMINISELNFNAELHYYNQFFIPKRTGGLRKILAPTEELKEVQRKIVRTLQGGVLVHNAAYAYVKNTSSYDALKRHQQNESKWFLKIDLKDFFPSCTREVVESSLSQIYPLGKVNFDTLMEVLNRWCFYEDSLPQGAVTSPLLSNLVMLPYDYRISTALINFNQRKFIYTRYADDILISCKYDFNKETVINLLTTLLTPFIINEEKTRYGSSAGQNWNLGLMLNKDNEITIGHKQKQRFKAMLQNLFSDYTSQEPEKVWTAHDVSVLQGLYSYYSSIEPDYIAFILSRLEAKHNVRLQNIRKDMTWILTR